MITSKEVHTGDIVHMSAAPIEVVQLAFHRRCMQAALRSSRRSAHYPRFFVNIYICRASSSAKESNRYPYPPEPRPTAFQIFHLPRHASASDVKQRYYELVRIHHPDTAITQFGVPPDVAHARFQAITSAYDTLRSDSSREASDGTARHTRWATAAAWRAATQTRRRDIHAEGDEGWKDKIILLGVVLSIAGFVAQMAFFRQQTLADVRQPPNDHIRRLSKEAAEQSLALPSDNSQS